MTHWLPTLIGSLTWPFCIVNALRATSGAMGIPGGRSRGIGCWTWPCISLNMSMERDIATSPKSAFFRSLCASIAFCSDGSVM